MSGERYHPWFIGSDNLGLHQVRPSADNVQYTCDIFIIHGLNGGAARTWRHENNAIWFRDFLPDTLKDDTEKTNAKIWTYGYPANANFSRPVCDMTPFQFAQDLLLRVKAARNGREEAHKVIWICHSLGGIVVKNALVQARERSEYLSIWSSTVGVLFMGTPHLGSSAANVGDVTLQIAKACGVSTDRNLLKHLKPNCDSLASTAAKFAQIASHIKIYSFYETKPQIRDRLVVTWKSALLNIPDETTAPLHSNHCDMGKYSGFDDSNYAPVSFAISELMKLTSFEHRPSLDSKISISSSRRLTNGSTTTLSRPRSGYTDIEQVPSSPFTQPSISDVKRRPEIPLGSMPEESFAAIVRDGNLAHVDSAIDTAIELNKDQLLFWKAKALQYSLEIRDSRQRFEIFNAYLNAQTAQLDEPDSYGNYLPHRIVLSKNNDSSYLRALFAAGVDLNSADAKPGRGYRPLHLAAKNNRMDAVNYLVTNKLLINAPDASKRTPLWHAVNELNTSDSRMRIVEVLLANGGDRAPYPKNEIYEKSILKLYKKHGLKNSKADKDLYCRR